MLLIVISVLFFDDLIVISVNFVVSGINITQFWVFLFISSFLVTFFSYQLCVYRIKSSNICNLCKINMYQE